MYLRKGDGLYYPDEAFRLRAIDALSVKYCVREIGKSRCGRGIFALQSGSRADVPLIAAGFHGMEYLTVLAALRFARPASP